MGSTRREAMKVIHHSAMKLLKAVEVEAQHSSMDSLCSLSSATVLDTITRNIFNFANTDDSLCLTRLAHTSGGSTFL